MTTDLNIEGVPPFLRRGHPDCWVKPQNSKGDDMAKIGPKEQQRIDLRIRNAKATSSQTIPASTRAQAEPQEDTMLKNRKTKVPAKARQKTKGALKKKSKIPNDVRAGSKLEIVANLLKRPEGCTTADALTATGWPAISMPAQAKAAGLTLKKEKNKGEPTRYRAA